MFLLFRLSPDHCVSHLNPKVWQVVLEGTRTGCQFSSHAGLTEIQVHNKILAKNRPTHGLAGQLRSPSHEASACASRRWPRLLRPNVPPSTTSTKSAFRDLPESRDLLSPSSGTCEGKKATVIIFSWTAWGLV